MSSTWLPFFYKTLWCQAYGSRPDIYVDEDARLFLTSELMPSTSGETTVFLVHAELRNAIGFAPIHAWFLVPSYLPEKSWESYFPLLFPRVLPQCPFGLYCVYEKNVHHNDYVNSFIVVIDDLLRNQHSISDTSNDNTLLTPNAMKISTIVLDPANAALCFPVHNLQPLLTTSFKTRTAAELGTLPNFDSKHNCTSSGCLLNALDLENSLRTKLSHTNVEYLNLPLSAKAGDTSATVKAIEGVGLVLMHDTVGGSKVRTAAVTESIDMAVPVPGLGETNYATVNEAPVHVGGGPGRAVASHLNHPIDTQVDTEAFDPAIIKRGPKKGHRNQESTTTLGTQNGSAKGSRGHTPNTSISSIASEPAFSKDDQVSHTSNKYPKAFLQSETPYAGRNVSSRAPHLINSCSGMIEIKKNSKTQPSVHVDPMQVDGTKEPKPVTKSQRKRGRERKAEKAKKLKEQQLAEAAASKVSSSTAPDTHGSSTSGVKEEELPETGRQNKQRKKGANNAKLAKKGNVISKAALIAKVQGLSEETLPIKARAQSISTITVTSKGSLPEASKSSRTTSVRVPSLTEFSPCFTATPQEMNWEVSHNEKTSTEYKFQLTELSTEGDTPTPSEKTDITVDPVSVREESDDVGSQSTLVSETLTTEKDAVKFDIPESSDFNPRFTAPPQEMKLDVSYSEELSTEYKLRLPQLEPALVEQIDVVKNSIGVAENPEEANFQNELSLLGGSREPDTVQDESTASLISHSPAHLSWQIVRPNELWRNVELSNLQEWRIWPDVRTFDEGEYGPFYLIRRMALHIPSSMVFEDHCEMLLSPNSPKLFFSSLLQSPTSSIITRDAGKARQIDGIARTEPALCTKDLQRGMEGTLLRPDQPYPLTNLCVSIKIHKSNQSSGQGSPKGRIEFPLGEVQAGSNGVHYAQDGEESLIKGVSVFEDDSTPNDLMPVQDKAGDIVSDSGSGHAGIDTRSTLAILEQGPPKIDIIHQVTASKPQEIKEFDPNPPKLYEINIPSDSTMALPPPNAVPVVSPVSEPSSDSDSSFCESSDDDRSKVLKLPQQTSETVEDSTSKTKFISNPVLASDALCDYDVFVFEFSDDQRPKDPTMPQNRPANTMYGCDATVCLFSPEERLKESTLLQNHVSETVEDSVTKATSDPVLAPNASYGYGPSLFEFPDEERPKDPMMPQNRPAFVERINDNYLTPNKSFGELGSFSENAMVAATKVIRQEEMGKALRQAQNAACRGPNLFNIPVVTVVSPSVTEDLDSASDSTIVAKDNTDGVSSIARINEVGQMATIDSETIDLMNHDGIANQHMCLPRLSFVFTLLAKAMRRAADALHHSTNGPFERQDTESASLDLEHYLGRKTIWFGKQGVKVAKAAATIALIPADMTIQAAIIPIQLTKTGFSVGLWAGSRFGPFWMKKLLEPTGFGTWKSKSGSKASMG